MSDVEEPTDNIMEQLIDNVRTLQVTESDNVLQEAFTDLECPYNWRLEDNITPHSIIRDIKDKLAEESDDFLAFSHSEFNKFTLHLLMTYLLTNKEQFTEAKDIINICIQTLQSFEDQVNTEPLYEKIKDALWHVTLASQAYTLVKSGDQRDVKKVFNRIPKVSEMSDVQRAGIYGMEAYMLMQYGHSGNMLALELAKKARDLDPEMAEWWFLVGKAMGRIRRITERMECVEKEEIRVLEKAVELNDCASYMVFLAQTYRECSLRSFKKYQNHVDLKTHELGRYIDIMNEKSLKLYLQALEKRANSPRMMSRCAAGLLRLPGRYKRLQIAEDILMKSLALSPNNSYTHHVVGLLYYNWPYRNFQKALFHYKKAHECGNYGASMDILRLKCEMNVDYDPYEDLISYIDQYKEGVHQISISCELGSYFLFKKLDIVKAIEHYTVVLNEGNILSLKSNFVAFLSLDGPINLLKITIDEARLALQNSNSLSKEDKLAIRKFIIVISRMDPKMLEDEPEPDQVRKILEKSEFRMMPKDKHNNIIGERLKMELKENDGHWVLQNQEAQGERGRGKSYRGMRGNSDSRTRSERGWNQQDTRHGRERTWERWETKQSDRGSRGHRARGSSSELQSWRSRSDSDRTETNWRLRSDDDRTDYQRPQSAKTVNKNENLKDRCWRTKKPAVSHCEDTYKFPVKKSSS